MRDARDLVLRIAVASTVFALGCGARTDLEASGLELEAPPATAGTGGGMVLLFGGLHDLVQLGTSLNDTWSFDGSSWSKASVSTPPPPRVFPSMATLGDEVVLFGGSEAEAGYGTSNNGILDDTWMSDGSTWTTVGASSAPPPREGAAMATLGNSVVMFGGNDFLFNRMSDTWTFNGSTWTQVAGSPSPPARTNASMAALGNRIVLFGGDAASAPGQGISEWDDTWIFDGASWSSVTAPTSPPGRSDASMATLGDRVVLFGGLAFGTPAFDDVWTFDGSSWSQVSASSGPTARTDPSMAALASQVVLFGGFDEQANFLGDTWTFDGSSWSQCTGSP